MNFDQYYKSYLEKHQNRWNRRLHILGNLLTLALLVFILCNLSSYWWLFIALPFVVYLPAFPGHWLFEGNQPALFSINPFWAKMADWKMMWEILTGKLPL